MLFEHLESRRLMSFTTDLDLQTGVLFVRGTADHDALTVTELPELYNPSTGRGVVRVVDHNEPEDSPFRERVLTGVDSFVLDLGGAFDVGGIEVYWLSAILSGGGTGDDLNVQNGGAPVAVLGGDGNDLIHVQDFSDVGTVILAGSGDDTLWIELGSKVETNPTLAYGGDGNDHFIGPQGDTELIVDDNTATVIGYIPGETGSGGYARLYGGNGNDVFVTFDSSTIVNGGSGADEATVFAEDLGQISSVRNLDFVPIG